MDAPFEVVRTTGGALSIRNKRVNEIMHNPVGPWIEANSLYVEQSTLREKLQDASAPELVIFDVGLGAAANALAAMHCAHSFSARRRLRIVSFERDLELLAFALRESAHFEHFRGFEGAIATILEQGTWSDSRVSWELRRGDFVELIRAEPHRADIVFYDPYSPQVNSDMWTLQNFRNLRAQCADRGILLTYSKATPIRTALLCAGFFVGAGRGIGEKDETTLATTQLRDLPQPFAERWFERWQKSSVPFPLQTPLAERAEIARAVRTHPQFAGLTNPSKI